MLTFPAPSDDAPSSGPLPNAPRLRLYFLAAAGVILFAVVALGSLQGQPAQDMGVTYGQSASSDLLAAGSMVPSAYVQGARANGTCTAAGCLSAATATFGRPEEFGSTGASVRISVFNSSDNARAGYDAAVGVVKAKSGYVDISSTLDPYAGQGSCFGAGAATMGGSTATIYCTKNNVLFLVTFESTLSLDGLRAEMPEVLGAVYSGIG